MILGVAGGIAIWASVEALLAQAVFAVVLAYLLLSGLEDGLARIVDYALALLATIVEFQPLMPTSLERLLFFLLHFSPVLVGGGALVYKIMRDGEPPKDVDIVFLIPLTVYGGLALSSGRWVIYAQAIKSLGRSECGEHSSISELRSTRE